jgi:hypothetical protein
MSELIVFLLRATFHPLRKILEQKNTEPPQPKDQIKALLNNKDF